MLALTGCSHRPTTELGPSRAVEANSASLNFKVQLAQQNSGEEVEIKIVPNQGLHFNLHAPQSVQAESDRLSFESKRPDLFVLRVKQAALKNSLFLQLYTCDTQETFCIGQRAQLIFRGRGSDNANKQSLTLEQLAPVANSGEAESSGQTLDASADVNVSSKVDAHGFLVNNLPLAESMAKSGFLLIDFSAVWCPACLRFDEEVLNTKEFRNATASLTKLRIDSDWPAGEELRTQYHIRDFPTLLLTADQGRELARFHGFRPLSQMQRELREFAARKLKIPLAKIEEEAKKGNRLAMDEAGIAAFNALRMSDAVEFLEHSGAERSRYLLAKLYLLNEKIDSASKSNQPPLSDLLQAKEALLSTLIRQQPMSVDLPRWWLQAAQLAMQQGNSFRSEKNAENAVRSAHALLRNPKRLRTEFSFDPERDEVEIGTYELWAIRAEAFQLERKPDRAADAWSRAIKILQAAPQGAGQGLTLVRYLEKAGRENEVNAILRELEKKYPENYIFS